MQQLKWMFYDLYCWHRASRHTKLFSKHCRSSLLIATYLMHYGLCWYNTSSFEKCNYPNMKMEASISQIISPTKDERRLTDFSSDPFGVWSVPASASHFLYPWYLLTNGWNFTKLARIYHWDKLFSVPTISPTPVGRVSPNFHEFIIGASLGAY